MALFGSPRRQRAAAFAATTMLAGAGVLSLGMASAGAGTVGVCSGSTIYALDVELSQVGENGEVHVVDLTEPLAPGRYEVDTIAFDGYPGRTEDNEREAYYIEFVDASGNVVGRTGETPELPDDVEIVERAASFTVTMTGTATQMRLIQVVDFIDPGDEVEVGCVGITALVDPSTTTTQPSTTTTPPSTTGPTTPTTGSTTLSTVAPVTVTTARAGVAGTAVTTAATAAPVVRAQSSQLPVTGGETLPLAVVGTALLGAGAALVLRARRMS